MRSRFSSAVCTACFPLEQLGHSVRGSDVEWYGRQGLKDFEDELGGAELVLLFFLGLFFGGRFHPTPQSVLELTNTLSQPLPKLGQLSRSKQDQHDEQNEK